MGKVFENILVMVAFGGLLVHGLMAGRIVSLFRTMKFGQVMVSRAESPEFYWFVVFFYALVAAMSLYFLVGPSWS